ncbi:S1 family peptidase [Gandjariella thermophila]|nr:S1 family peptidase [Gandjariella thermophila]
MAGTSPAMSVTSAEDPQVSPEILAAMQRDLGLTPRQATARLLAEAHAGTVERQLQASLGEAFGGAWFDAAANRLVVGVTDAGRAEAVRAAGADARVVTFTERQLDAAKAALDAMPAPRTVNGWYVDPQSNSVVVEVNGDGADPATRAFLSGARAQGGMVRVVTESAAPRLLYNVRGGDAWYGSNFRCSVGFNAVDSGGGKHFVTAGHCTASGGSAYGYNQVYLGRINGSHFGSGGDYGKVDVTSSSWSLVGTVNRYDGTSVAVRGSTAAAVGSSVCRSGSTTGWHCGTIQAKNQTVNYAEGTVTGLTRTNVCAEPGDSGGSWISGNQAQGVTSGGSGDCTWGGTTYFSPVNPALSAYGLRLVTG